MWRPTLLEINTITETVYYNSDLSLWLWKDPSSGKWTISATLLPQITVDGAAYVSDYRTLNNKFYYTNSLTLWYDSDNSRYVISSYVGYGTDEYWDEDAGQYQGDAWWTCATLAGSYVARGSLRGSVEGAYNGTPKTVAVQTINGWESDGQFGEYSAIAGGGATGNKYVGWKKLTGDNGLGDLQQISLQQNSKYIFRGDKYLWYDGINWIINGTPGTKDGAVGYWQGSAPPTPSSTTTVYSLVYTGESPDPTPSSYTLTFDSYVAGNETSEAIQGQLAVWLRRDES